MRLRDKLKTFYLYYHDTYGHQIWHVVDIQWKLPSIKSHFILWTHGLVVLISLIRFVGLECKRLQSLPISSYNCLKSKTLCICRFAPCSSSPQLFWIIWEFGAKKYLHIEQLRQISFLAYFFLNKLQWNGISQRLLHKCGHLFFLHIIKIEIN